MRGRVTVGLLAACVLVCCADPGLSKSAAAAHVCGPASGKTLAADAVARVYSAGHMVYGCSAQTGVRTTLGSTRVGPNSRTTVGIVVLAGAAAAYASYYHGTDFGNATVNVSRLTDGQRLSSSAAVRRAFVESFQTVTSLAVRSDGAVAWIAEVQSIIANAKSVSVHESVDGRATLLDRSKTIGTRSLRLKGSRLSWKHGGKTRHATLG